MSSPFAGGRQPSRRMRWLLGEAEREASARGTGPQAAADGRAPDPGSAVEFRSVSTTIDRIAALRSVSFNAQVGHLTAVVGAAGLAKSTLVELVLGRRVPDEGDVFVLRESIRQRRRPRGEGSLVAAPPVGIVPRDGGLFSSRTVQENVGLLLANGSKMTTEEIDARVAVQLERLDLAHLALCLPGDLAMGQRKRIALARAMVSDPELIVLDEPEAGLDADRTGLFMELIAHFQAESRTSYLMVTQDLPLACQIADEVVMMNRGAVIAEGTVPELMRSGNRYAKALLEEATGASSSAD